MDIPKLGSTGSLILLLTFLRAHSPSQLKSTPQSSWNHISIDLRIDVILEGVRGSKISVN